MPACYAELGIGAVLGERRLSEKRNSPSAISALIRPWLAVQGDVRVLPDTESSAI
jgi:hypothetical protein